jgi:hypothetical protein
MAGFTVDDGKQGLPEQGKVAGWQNEKLRKWLHVVQTLSESLKLLIIKLVGEMGLPTNFITGRFAE